MFHYKYFLYMDKLLQEDFEYTELKSTLTFTKYVLYKYKYVFLFH